MKIITKPEIFCGIYKMKSEWHDCFVDLEQRQLDFSRFPLDETMVNNNQQQFFLKIIFDSAIFLERSKSTIDAINIFLNEIRRRMAWEELRSKGTCSNDQFLLDDFELDTGYDPSGIIHELEERAFTYNQLSDLFRTLAQKKRAFEHFENEINFSLKEFVRKQPEISLKHALLSLGFSEEQTSLIVQQLYSVVNAPSILEDFDIDGKGFDKTRQGTLKFLIYADNYFNNTKHLFIKPVNFLTAMEPEECRRNSSSSYFKI